MCTRCDDAQERRIHSGTRNTYRKQRSTRYLLDRKIAERRHSRRFQNRSRRLHHQTVQHGRAGIPYRSHSASSKRETEKRSYNVQNRTIYFRHPETGSLYRRQKHQTYHKRIGIAEPALRSCKRNLGKKFRAENHLDR